MNDSRLPLQGVVELPVYSIVEDLERSLRAFTFAIDFRDGYMRGHSERVNLFSLAIGQVMGLTSENLAVLAKSAMLHDIGKIGVKNSILNKPEKLTVEEYTEMKKHPIIGAEICSTIQAYEQFSLGIRYHHERFDGTGYPEGLCGMDIPLHARIICVADAFDAMTSHRSYRESALVDAALMEVRSCTSTQFDPHIVDAFFQAMSSGLIHVNEGALL